MESRSRLWFATLGLLLATVVWFAYAVGREQGEQAGAEVSHANLARLRIAVWGSMERAAADEEDAGRTSADGRQFAGSDAVATGEQAR